MVPVSLLLATQRSERRIAVRLPLKLKGCDSSGVPFEEDTSSENLCRSGAAFVTRFDVKVGTDVEIHIPFSNHTPMRVSRAEYARNLTRFPMGRSDESDFSTQGRVVHVSGNNGSGGHYVGVQFTGPRFQRVFRSESGF